MDFLFNIFLKKDFTPTTNGVCAYITRILIILHISFSKAKMSDPKYAYPYPAQGLFYFSFFLNFISLCDPLSWIYLKKQIFVRDRLSMRHDQIRSLYFHDMYEMRYLTHLYCPFLFLNIFFDLKNSPYNLQVKRDDMIFFYDRFHMKIGLYKLWLIVSLIVMETKDIIKGLQWWHLHNISINMLHLLPGNRLVFLRAGKCWPMNPSFLFYRIYNIFWSGNNNQLN